MFNIHRFPRWIGNGIAGLSAKLNTDITMKTKQVSETSELIRFKKGLPQGDALCPTQATNAVFSKPCCLEATSDRGLPSV